MPEDVVVDLRRDYAAACATALNNAGYTPPASADDRIQFYWNVRHRRVPVRLRTVHRAAYVVPPLLVQGEQAFLADVAAGADLRPYQSTRLERADFNDGMLNDFGIQHFHLGTAPHPTKPGFKARTEPVLFAMVKPDDFYSLGCFAHGAWSQQALLDLIHTTWPPLMAPSSPSRGQDGSRILGLRHSYTDAEVATLRSAGINVFTQRPDGTVHMSPGGGVTTKGTSVNVSRVITDINSTCFASERDIKTSLTPMIASGQISAPVTVVASLQGNRMVAEATGTGKRFDLGEKLFVAPL